VVAVDSESIPASLPEIPIWIHFGGSNTLSNIVAAHRQLVERLGKGGWTSAPPRQGTPSALRLFTDWTLESTDPVKNHTSTSTRTYADSRVYEWLREGEPSTR
jgi:hypothetical protein